MTRYRRKQSSKTDYRLRMKLLESRKPRLVIRKTNKYLIAQIVKYSDDGDVVVAGVSTKQLAKHGWTAAGCNIPAAYLTGLLLAKQVKAKKVSEAIVDLGMQSSKKGGRLYAVVKGAIDGGLNIPCDAVMFPPAERLSGQHIQAHAAQRTLTKTKAAAETISTLIQKTKQRIEG